MRLATIDIGTNTTLLLIADTGPDGSVRVLEERAEITRLGRGIGSGQRLGADGIARTLAVLRQYADAAHQHGARIAAIGTEGLRRATNAAEFLTPAAEILGAPVEVIDGDREAALTFRAVDRSFPELRETGALTVVDIGGGSTEIIVAAHGEVRFHTSVPLGSVRLTERFVRHDPAQPEELEAVRSEIRRCLTGAPLPDGGALAGVAGTVTSLAAMALSLDSYDPARVHGFRLSRKALQAEIARLARSTQAEREAMVGLDPRRADVILAGALILEILADLCHAPEIVVSDRGIRWGLLHELAG